MRVVAAGGRTAAARLARGLALVVALAGSLAASGCATVAAGTFERTVQGRGIEGRLSVRYKDLETGKEDALSGRFVWTANADAIELSLLDPLGQTVALIRADARASSITFRDGRRVDGATTGELTRRTLGWTVPLEGLGSWLEGRADPSRPAATLADGRLRQDDWTIRFQPDDTLGPDAPPRRIDLAYPGPPVEIEMRLVVDRRDAS